MAIYYNPEIQEWVSDADHMPTNTYEDDNGNIHPIPNPDDRYDYYGDEDLVKGGFYIPQTPTRKFLNDHGTELAIGVLGSLLGGGGAALMRRNTLQPRNKVMGNVSREALVGKTRVAPNYVNDANAVAYNTRLSNVVGNGKPAQFQLRPKKGVKPYNGYGDGWIQRGSGEGTYFSPSSFLDAINLNEGMGTKGTPEAYYVGYPEYPRIKWGETPNNSLQPLSLSDRYHVARWGKNRTNNLSDSVYDYLNNLFVR